MTRAGTGPAAAGGGAGVGRLAAARRGLVWLRRHAASLVLGAVLLGLLGGGAAAFARLAGYTTGICLRYSPGITGAAAAAARQYAVQHPQDSPWPTFWRQDTLPMESPLASGRFPCVVYSGQGALVWPARFVAGGWPGATDEAGCVVSEALAWQLWGSHAVVGRTLTLDGQVYTVRGVMQGDEALCLACAGDDAAGTNGWQGVDFHRRGRSTHTAAKGASTADADGPAPDAGTTSSGDAAFSGSTTRRGLSPSDAQAFAQAAGLGTAGQVVSGGGVLALGGVLAFAPAGLLTLVLLVRGGRRLHTRHPAACRVAGWVALGALLLCLPGWLAALPGWLLPAKWSDFSHWSGLWQHFTGFVGGLLGLAPTLRDVQMKACLLALLFTGCAGTPLALWLAGRLGRRPGA